MFLKISLCHRGQPRPLLPLLPDILALIEVDWTARGLLLARCELCPAGDANPMLYTFHTFPKLHAANTPLCANVYLTCCAVSFEGLQRGCHNRTSARICRRFRVSPALWAGRILIPPNMVHSRRRVGQ